MGDQPAPTAPAQALGFLFVGGAVLGLLTVLIDKHPETSMAGVLALVAVALAAGAAMLRAPRRFSRTRLDVLCGLGTLILGVGCVLAGPNPYGVMFLWTGMYAVAYLPDTARLHLAAIAVVLAVSWALASHNDQQPVAGWFTIAGALAMAALVIGRLLDRLESHGRRTAARAALLARSEDRLRAMLETTEDGFLALDARGEIVDCNASFAAMLGRRRADVVGQSYAELALPEDGRAAHVERRTRMLGGGRFEPFEVELVRADGSRLRAQVSGSGLRVGDEELVAGFVRDLSLRDEAAREHRIAERLQRSLLPERLPDIAGLTVAARYVPAAAEADVGGDWFDAVELPGGRLALAMGDVAGKGLAAAASVGRLRSTLRAYALEHHDPGLVLDRLERTLALDEDAADLITVVLVVVDVEGRRLRWASAGHPPPLLLDPEGGTRWLEGARGTPIGAGLPGRRPSAEIGVPADATVVLYTDGLIERRNAPLQAGLDRLEETARGCVGAGPEALVDALLRAAGVQDGGADDVAVLAAHVRPLGPRLELELPTRGEELARLRAALRRWLAERGRTDPDLVLAATEAATNAVEHTRGPRAGTFTVTASEEHGGVVVEVCSAGDWRPRSGPRTDRGRGLSMMRALVDDVAVETADGVTTVRLVRDGPARAR